MTGLKLEDTSMTHFFGLGLDLEDAVLSSNAPVVITNISGTRRAVSFQTKSDEKLDTRRAIVVVETILSHFSERRFLIADYYEQWKVHVVSGKEFKSQWQQFIQNARKVPAAPAFTRRHL